jgi:membrane-associated phospholipid phosphatase
MPLAAIVLIWLFLIRSFRCAAWWTISVLLCLIVTFVLKLSFDQCPPIPQLHSPSGHTSLSTLVYGAITLVATAQTNGWLKKVMFGGGVSLIVAIAASRLYLNAHSLSEVGLGFVVGAASLMVFSQSYRQYEGTSVVQVILLIAVSGLLTIVLHGRSLDTQVVLQGIASYFRIYCAWRT